MTVNSPPATGNGALVVGTPATSITFPAFSTLSVRDAGGPPIATLPKLIDFALSFSLPPAPGVGVPDGVGVANVVGVAPPRSVVGSPSHLQ